MTDPATLAAIRFGYGLPLPDGAPTEPAAMIAALAGADRAAVDWPGIALPEALLVHLAAATARRKAREGDTARAVYKEAVRAVDEQAQRAARATAVRALASPDGLRERLVRFWADHFTTVGRFRQDRALPAALVEHAIRPHVAGRFADMLKAAVMHPAMLVYLDQILSWGPGSPEGQRLQRGLNENLARELLELHTLGVGGGYGQADVRQMAELLTGLTFKAGVGQVFEPGRAEPGPEEVLGRLYDGEGLEPIHAVLEDLAVRPETARHLARKLAVHFVADQPDPALVDHLAGVWLDTGGDLAAVAAALLAHPAAWSGPLTKARQPFDFVVSAVRALGLRPEKLNALGRGRFRRQFVLPMAAMGQPWEAPGGPDGWPEAAEAWITPQGLAARIAWAMEAPEGLVKPLPDPRDLALRALGPLASERLLWAAARAETVREGVGLVLASPEFNRR